MGSNEPLWRLSWSGKAERHRALDSRRCARQVCFAICFVVVSNLSPSFSKWTVALGPHVPSAGVANWPVSSPWLGRQSHSNAGGRRMEQKPTPEGFLSAPPVLLKKNKNGTCFFFYSAKEEGDKGWCPPPTSPPPLPISAEASAPPAECRRLGIHPLWSD